LLLVLLINTMIDDKISHFLSLNLDNCCLNIVHSNERYVCNTAKD